MKMLSSKIVFENPWIKLLNEKFVLPNGQEGEYAVIEREPGVMILVLLAEDDTYYTYLVKQYRYPIGKEIWQFPMGNLEKGKDLKAHAIDELRQETGLIVEDLIQVNDIYVDPGLSRQKCVVFLATEIKEQKEQELDASEEGMKVRKIALDDLEKMVLEGEINDGWGFIGVYLLQREMQRKK